MAKHQSDNVIISSKQLSLEVSCLGASVIGLHIGRYQYSVIRAITAELYPEHIQHFGAITGPVANRIRNGIAPCFGTPLQLDKNEASNIINCCESLTNKNGNVIHVVREDLRNLKGNSKITAKGTYQRDVTIKELTDLGYTRNGKLFTKTM